MAVSDEVWKQYQELLGYTDEELDVFKNNPVNEDIISKAPELMKKTFVLEVVESHGCASQHKVGDRLYFDGSGSLITKLAPKKVCVEALCAGAPLIAKSMELIFAGVDPNEMRFNRAGCNDVGLRCGGWGRVVLEFKAEDRK